MARTHRNVRNRGTMDEWDAGAGAAIDGLVDEGEGVGGMVRG